MKKLIIISLIIIFCYSCKNTPLNNEGVNKSSQNFLKKDSTFKRQNKDFIINTSLEDSINLIYIGKKYKDPIKNYKNWGGQLISIIDLGEEVEMLEKFSYNLYSDDDYFIYCFEEINIENKTILDTIMVAKKTLSKKSTIVVSCDYILNQNKIISPVFAIAPIEKKENDIYQKIVKAWGFDFKNKKIILLDSNKVICANEGDWELD